MYCNNIIREIINQVNTNVSTIILLITMSILVYLSKISSLDIFKDKILCNYL